MKQVNIAKYFNASPGTISDIIKELKKWKCSSIGRAIDC